MTRFQRFKHFLSYFYKDSAIFIGFSVASIAGPVAMTAANKWHWSDWSLWFWLIVMLNILNLAITIVKYIQYIRFNR